MRIGISAYWFNRGQAVVARQLRSALDSLGHETYVLARPTRGRNLKPAFIDHSDVWNQPGITEASAYLIPRDEMLDWARQRELEVAFFDQNYQFEEIAALRELGVRTIGRFVWEQFSDEHTEGAQRAFETIYSMTACEQERYTAMGIQTPRVRWGIHPELLGYAGESQHDSIVRLFYPGGFMSKRKPVQETLDAFRNAKGDGLRLLVKAQVDRQEKSVRKAARKDKRISLITDDLPTDEHLRLFASADVCLAPSRWEGLGLHLYEAMALGLPVITNDNPPMNEIVRDGVNGLLVRGVPSKQESPSGIGAFDPDPRELSAAIERIADPELRTELTAGVDATREQLRWDTALEDLRQLLDSP